MSAPENINEKARRYFNEVTRVVTLCEEIGHGNVMDIASRNWAEKLVREGGSGSGAFVPTIIHDIKQSEIKRYKIEYPAAFIRNNQGENPERSVATDAQ